MSLSSASCPEPGRPYRPARTISDSMVTVSLVISSPSSSAPVHPPHAAAAAESRAAVSANTFTPEAAVNAGDPLISGHDFPWKAKAKGRIYTKTLRRQQHTQRSSRRSSRGGSSGLIRIDMWSRSLCWTWMACSPPAICVAKR